MLYKNFIDSVIIFVKGGSGGSGYFSYKKTRLFRIAQQIGGTGGFGGNVYVKINLSLLDLSRFSLNRFYTAGIGTQGGPNKINGSSGKDIVLDIPLGTKVIDYLTGRTMCLCTDVTKNKILLAKGGSPGCSNSGNLISLCNRGTLGAKYCLRFDLLLKSDICLFGNSNSGKSTFINFVTLSHTLTGSNIYTTIRPKIMVTKSTLYSKNYIFLDLPGIVCNDFLYFFFDRVFLQYFVNSKIILVVVDLNFSCKMNLLNSIKHTLFELRKRETTKKYNLNKKLFLTFNKSDILTKKVCTKMVWFFHNFVKLQTTFFLASSYTGFGFVTFMKYLNTKYFI